MELAQKRAIADHFISSDRRISQRVVTRSRKKKCSVHILPPEGEGGSWCRLPVWYFHFFFPRSFLKIIESIEGRITGSR